MSDAQPKLATGYQALIPILALIVMLFLSRWFFEDSSSSGPNQIALILSAAIGILVGLYNGFTWKDMEGAMVKGISLSMGAIFILLVVGSLIGTWILAGIVPTMIYYGLDIMNPSIFFLASCLICAFIALATGSSWTTVSTIGIALVGIATAMNLNLGLTAGAVISGAYFGDKLSPLSDTTNLAPAMAGTDLFTHIRHMLWTTVPSMTIACILFLILGFFFDQPQNPDEIAAIQNAINVQFNVGPHLLIPLVLVLVLVYKKIPAFPALLIGALVGGLFAVLFQQEAVMRFVGEDIPKWRAMLQGPWMVMFGEYSMTSDNEALQKLLDGRGGMASMLSTVWLILSAMMFGAVMERTGVLEVMAKKILGMAKSTGSLVVATLGTSMGMNVIASDQYIAIVLPGRMFRAEFLNRKLAPKNLSRCLEDAGTLTSPLVPWNTCGAYMAQTLQVATLTYLPFCFFNLLNPIISAIYGFTGFSMEKLEEDTDIEEMVLQPEAKH